LLSVSIVDFVEAVQLLTDDCPQSGQYVQVDSSQALNLVQGCVEVDDRQQPELRIINPKSFFYEIKPISGGNGYPVPTLLAPGDEVKFEASTSDPSPLIIQAEITQKSGWYLVIHMIISMLPGANQFGIQPSSVACITERLEDVSALASAVESLLNNNGAAAAESISNFMLDGDAVRRFLTAADDCNFGPAPTWSVEGIKQIGGAVSTIMSATDYIANYFAGNTNAQLSFTWTPFPEAEIAYMGTDRFGNQIDIRLVSSDGSHIITIPLDNSAPDEYIPAYGDIKFSPNGQFIAFGRSKYTNREFDTPDGKVLLKVSSGLNELVVVDLSTNKAIIVINPFDGAFDWSPDNRNILHIYNGGLWMTDIYTGEENEFMPPLQDNPIMNIKWSPNGNFIAFHEYIYLEGYGPFGIMKSDGSNIISWKNQVGEFDWSPDGSMIVFDEVLYSLQKGLRLYIANPDGSNQRILFEDQDLAATHPRWSPDGRSIAFLISPADFPLGSPNSLWIIETSSNNLHQLTSKDLESVSGMSWSPDSNKLVVSAINGFQMYVISLDGESFYLGQGIHPVWRP
jgi:WD40 repeat protein